MEKLQNQTENNVKEYNPQMQTSPIKLARVTRLQEIDQDNPQNNLQKNLKFITLNHKLQFIRQNWKKTKAQSLKTGRRRLTYNNDYDTVFIFWPLIMALFVF